VHLRLGLDLPDERAVEAQAVEVRVVRPDQHAIADNDRRRLDLGPGLEGPPRLAVRRADGVQHASQVADEDQIARDSGG
jgi:hypothetical protein